jgi:hypothetical protein
MCRTNIDAERFRCLARHLESLEEFASELGLKITVTFEQPTVVGRTPLLAAASDLGVALARLRGQVEDLMRERVS